VNALPPEWANIAEYWSNSDVLGEFRSLFHPDRGIAAYLKAESISLARLTTPFG